MKFVIARGVRNDCFLFFFSSRRRHTRWTGYWSSDVCSSDLPPAAGDDVPVLLRAPGRARPEPQLGGDRLPGTALAPALPRGDRKSTRLNSSHPSISYAVFCLKKKKKPQRSRQSSPEWRAH